jgi:hypothetical protein
VTLAFDIDDKAKTANYKTTDEARKALLDLALALRGLLTPAPKPRIEKNEKLAARVFALVINNPATAKTADIGVAYDQLKAIYGATGPLAKKHQSEGGPLMFTLVQTKSSEYDLEIAREHKARIESKQVTAPDEKKNDVMPSQAQLRVGSSSSLELTPPSQPSRVKETPPTTPDSKTGKDHSASELPDAASANDNATETLDAKTSDAQPLVAPTARTSTPAPSADPQLDTEPVQIKTDETTSTVSTPPVSDLGDPLPEKGNDGLDEVPLTPVTPTFHSLHDQAAPVDASDNNPPSSTPTNASHSSSPAPAPLPSSAPATAAAEVDAFLNAMAKITNDYALGASDAIKKEQKLFFIGELAAHAGSTAQPSIKTLSLEALFYLSNHMQNIQKRQVSDARFDHVRQESGFIRSHLGDGKGNTTTWDDLYEALRIQLLYRGITLAKAAANIESKAEGTQQKLPLSQTLYEQLNATLAHTSGRSYPLVGQLFNGPKRAVKFLQTRFETQAPVVTVSSPRNLP